MNIVYYIWNKNNDKLQNEYWINLQNDYYYLLIINTFANTMLLLQNFQTFPIYK